MTDRDARQFMGEMVAAHPYLRPIHAEHMDDNEGELLPHLLMADVCRWVMSNHHSQANRVRDLLGWLGGRFEAVGAGGDGVDNVIAASVIEHLPTRGT
ncbi:hypothetical protein StoSoilA2_20920 [Arthrobacter sp. StoSoilA2]|uniref:hypothetical protein n=1 Tax=Arthrobacter sp. StoSoilA2 TaxID=2830990 RepID=UPI001CC7AC67|nr:hypothetical protein [Arthrobacter sp. StoSoilA2]BCW36036.1 hypothetical protein StoSoilA2_20920 [Arthrobacter sp. StoSoilA2]